jgi:hypothetical protein
MYILVRWFSFGANFHHLMTQPKKNKKMYVYLVQVLQRIFVEKNVAKLPDFEGIIIERLSYRETVSSTRLPKYNRILKFSYFALWPMVKIWLIPLVDDHQFLPPDKPKRKESS